MKRAVVIGVVFLALAAIIGPSVAHPAERAHAERPALSAVDLAVWVGKGVPNARKLLALVKASDAGNVPVGRLETRVHRLVTTDKATLLRKAQRTLREVSRGMVNIQLENTIAAVASMAKAYEAYNAEVTP